MVHDRHTNSKQLGDLGALTRFLKLPILGDINAFRRYICAEAAASKFGKKPDFSNLRLLLASICLRRQQSFPSTTEVLRPVFSDCKRKHYQTLAVACKEALMAAVNSKSPRLCTKTFWRSSFVSGNSAMASTQPRIATRAHI